MLALFDRQHWLVFLSFILVQQIMKKLFSWSLLFGIALLPFFGGITEASSNQWLLRVSVPWDQWTKQDDVNIKTAWKTSNAVVGNEETLYSTLNLINDYLWWSFWAIAMGLTIYAGYHLRWGQKSYEKSPVDTNWCSCWTLYCNALKCNHQDCCQYYITI